MRPSYIYIGNPYTGKIFILGAPQVAHMVLTVAMTIPDSKVHEANMGPTWVMSAPDGSHVGPINLAIRDDNKHHRRLLNRSGLSHASPDSKVHGANMGLTWVLSAHMGPMLAPWTLL